MTHNDLQQYIKYQSSRGHPQELQVMKVLVTKFTETDLHYNNDNVLIPCPEVYASSQNCGGLMKH